MGKEFNLSEKELENWNKKNFELNQRIEDRNKKIKSKLKIVDIIGLLISAGLAIIGIELNNLRLFGIGILCILMLMNHSINKRISQNR